MRLKHPVLDDAHFVPEEPGRYATFMRWSYNCSVDRHRGCNEGIDRFVPQFACHCVCHRILPVLARYDEVGVM